MKVMLPTGKANCRVFGLEFDCEGIAEAKAEVVQSLLDVGNLITHIEPTKKEKTVK